MFIYYAAILGQAQLLFKFVIYVGTCSSTNGVFNRVKGNKEYYDYSIVLCSIWWGFPSTQWYESQHPRKWSFLVRALLQCAATGCTWPNVPTDRVRPS